MKIKGYVMCQPINTWGDETKPEWLPKTYTFSSTPLECWIRWINIPYGDGEWDRKIQAWIDRGYCIKNAEMEIKLDEEIE
jgi:hypothetical protein